MKKIFLLTIILFSVLLLNGYIYFDRVSQTVKQLRVENGELRVEKDKLLNEDQRLINIDLNNRIAINEAILKLTIKNFESYNDLNTNKFDKEFAAILADIAALNPTSAESKLASFSAMIKIEREKGLAASGERLVALPTINTPPDNGYRRQVVNGFTVDIITADLNSTRVVVETSSEGDCRDNCPVASLADFVARAGGYAGVNGTYFCPASYPSCAGKINSFDLLVMNRNKKYFNSDNNVYSTNPAAAFYGNTVRFMERASDWGRDTGVDAVLSNFPLLLLNGQIKFTGDGDAKHGGKGNRSFIAGHDSKAYIGVVYNATVSESAQVMSALGVQNAINLDDGGSTALIFQGSYKTGPGRALANGVIFVKK